MIGIYKVVGGSPLLQVNDITGIVPKIGDHVKTAAASYIVTKIEWHLTDETVTIFITQLA